MLSLLIRGCYSNQSCRTHTWLVTNQLTSASNARTANTTSRGKAGGRGRAVTLSWWQGGRSQGARPLPQGRWDEAPVPRRRREPSRLAPSLQGAAGTEQSDTCQPLLSYTSTRALFPGEFTAAPFLCPSCSASTKRNSWVKDDGEVRNSNKRNPDAFPAVQKDSNRDSRQAP